MKAALPHSLAATILAIAAMSSSCRTGGGQPDALGSSGQHAFRHGVKPLVEERCVWCHNNSRASAGLNFERPATVVAAAAKFVVPGKPDQSRIFLAVTRPNAHPRAMPGDGWGITANQKAMLQRWIEQGAVWPGGRAGKIRKKRYRVEFDDYL